MMKSDMGIGVAVAENLADPRTRSSEKRCDFFHRVRNDTEISKWRSELIDRLMRDPRKAASPEL